MGKLSRILSDVGAMDELISIRQYTYTTDATGGEVETASFLVENVFCEVLDTAQSDEGMRGENQQTVAWNRKKFTFRDFFPTITAKMRIVYDSDEYDILNIAKSGRNRFIVIEAEKRDNQT